MASSLHLRPYDPPQSSSAMAPPLSPRSQAASKPRTVATSTEILFTHNVLSPSTPFRVSAPSRPSLSNLAAANREDEFHRLLPRASPLTVSSFSYGFTRGSLCSTLSSDVDAIKFSGRGSMVTSESKSSLEASPSRIEEQIPRRSTMVTFRLFAH
ncbi:hypothetical protein Bca4012_025641 [Brassica carinata]